LQLTAIQALHTNQFEATEVAMKSIVAIITGLALSGGMALAQEQETTEDYEPNRDIVTETERDRGMGMETPRQDSPVQSEYGAETQTESDTDPYGTDLGESQTATEQSASTQEHEGHKDISQMSSDELSGKSVVTATGEEIGEIDEVGYSATHQQRVAVIEAGGILGVGKKRIAVPLSELQMGTDDSVTTTMTGDSIETQEEFDEAGFTTDQPDEIDQ
jgi:sporulation protein YlmC with PRC-barrel domain